jgi:protein involved in polysaccharide export with SLBB domain
MVGGAMAQSAAEQLIQQYQQQQRGSAGATGNAPITNNPADLDSRDLQQLQEQRQIQAANDLIQSRQRDLLDLPPEPDIEFQDFVTSSLGIHLPIFGQTLFRTVPSTFAPLDRVPVTPDYLIGPGDELLIRVWGQVDVNYRAVVDRNGAIYVPRIGAINVAGTRYDQLHSVVQEAIARVFKNFELNVTMGQLRSIQVFVVGQVRRPGSYTVSSLSTLVNALFASGGPSKRGSMRRIVLKRQGKEVTTFDLYDLLANGDKSKDAQLLPGDVIYVPPVGPLVALAGSVNIPAIYELKEHDTLGDLLNDAGGLTTTAGGQRVIIEGIDDQHTRSATEVLINDKGMKTELRPGDIIRFLHISPKFDNAVTLRGNVASPGRYPWKAGMHVKDLIPTRDILITEEYWKRQNKLGINPDADSFKLREERARDQRRQNGPNGQYGQYGQYGQSGDQNNRSGQPQQGPSQLGATTAPVPLQQGANQQPQQPQPNQYPDLQNPLPFDLSNGQYDDLSEDDLAARVGRTEAQRIKQEQLKNQVRRSGAEINWDYAVIQRLNVEDLTTHLVPFNLGKAIAGDPKENVDLQPGDIVTIFSQADMQIPTASQSKFVRLEGEFKSAGVYQAEPGEKLRHLIRRVGGLSPQAYLYGAELDRESTREDQQKRLEEYTNELEKSIERNASSQRNLTGEEAITEKQTQEGQRRLLDKLRQVRATGRIVLELSPNADNIDSLPDLVLEDGDRLLIPYRPATVNVIGSVYNSNSFIFKPGKTFGDYLRLSGGATRNGDKGRAFIIRADGTTVGNDSHRTLLASSFNTAHLMPGDTIVVPEKLDKGVVLRGFKDWTQIIGQFIIGAAAAKVLFP